VDLKQLRGVEAVARHRHFTRAAKELYVAQSALSHQIRQLERELGTPLFERTSRRVVITEAGQAIAARARRILAELDGAHADVEELRGVLRGRIWIGALLPAGGFDVPELLARFSRSHPGVEVGLREGIAADMLRLLSTDDLDAAFCLLAGDPPGEIAIHQLSHEEPVAAFAPGRAPQGSRVAVADLAGTTLVAPRRGSAITAVVEQRFADAGEPLHLALESGDPFLLRSLAAKGFATAILPRSLATLAGPAVAVRRLDPPARLPLVLAWRHSRALPPAARAFIDLVRHDGPRGQGTPAARRPNASPPAPRLRRGSES
jgi:DNA-binding transcriptional LysR family regulator